MNEPCVIVLTIPEVIAAMKAVTLQIEGMSIAFIATKSPFAVDREQFELLQSVQKTLFRVLDPDPTSGAV